MEIPREEEQQHTQGAARSPPLPRALPKPTAFCSPRHREGSRGGQGAARLGRCCGQLYLA